MVKEVNPLTKGRNSEQIRQDLDLRAKGNLSARFCIGLGLVVLAIGVMALPFLMMAALIVDPILKIAGCRGCIRDGGKQLIFDRTSFECVRRQS